MTKSARVPKSTTSKREKPPKKASAPINRKSLWEASSALIKSKGEAVADAMAAQLYLENHWPPEDFNRIMKDDYGYDLQTMSNFLLAVHNRLEDGSPTYNFQFDIGFVKASLSKTVASLTGAIYAKTS